MIEPDIYYPMEAGYNIEIDTDCNAIIISIYGLNKMSRVLQLVLDNFKVNTHVLETVKAIVKNSITNMYFAQPFVKIHSIIRKQLETDYYDHNDMLAVIDSVNLSNISDILGSRHTKCLLQGNLTQSEAIDLLPKKIKFEGPKA